MSQQTSTPKSDSPQFEPPKDTVEKAQDKIRELDSQIGQKQQATQGSVRGKRHRE